MPLPAAAPFLFDEIERQGAGLFPAPPGLVSLTLPLPEGWMPALPPGLEDYRFLARPQDGLHLLGHRIAARQRARGPGRFAALADFMAANARTWRRHDPHGLELGPRAFLGFSFAPRQPAADLLPDAEIAVPLLLLQQAGGKAAITLTLRAEPTTRPAEAIHLWQEALENLQGAPCSTGAEGNPRRLDGDPDESVWLDRVRRAVKDIRAGRLEKAVLTRRIRVAGEEPFEAAAVMERLARRHGSCTLFAFGGEAVTAVGATPERLVSLEKGRVRSDAVAGTLAGADGGALLDSAKDLHEHRLVAEAILSALRPVCLDLDHPRRPGLLRLSGLQHLWTPVSGRTRPGVGLLDLAARLHPTPAVGGSPYRVAMDWLARHGEKRLGWYTGGIGWLSPEGDGDLAVVLRCAALSGATATLSAGAGIVAGSEPEAELAETELKFSTMLEALGDG